MHTQNIKVPTNTISKFTKCANGACDFVPRDFWNSTIFCRPRNWKERGFPLLCSCSAVAVPNVGRKGRFICSFCCGNGYRVLGPLPTGARQEGDAQGSYQRQGKIGNEKAAEDAGATDIGYKAEKLASFFFSLNIWTLPHCSMFWGSQIYALLCGKFTGKLPFHVVK